MVSSKPPEPLQQFLYPSRKSAHALERLGWPLCTTNPQQIEATDHGRRLLVERMNIYYSSTQHRYNTVKTVKSISVVCHERRMSRWSVRVCDWSVYWGSILLLRRSRRLWRLVRRTTRLLWAISIRIFRNIRYDVSFRKLCLDYDVMIDRDCLLFKSLCRVYSLSVLSVFIFTVF